MRELESWILEYLLNSLWQVPVIFAVAWLLSRTLRSGSVVIEHRIWVVAIVLQSLLPAVSSHAMRWPGALLALIHLGGLPGASTVSVVIGEGTGRGMLRVGSGLSPILMTCYTIVLLYFASKLVWGYRVTLRTQRDAKQVPLPDSLVSRWESCRVAFGLRDARIALSTSIPGPMTMGLLRGIVLLPAGMMERLREDDLLAVFSHELAHISRRDFAKNLFYELLALPASYHPVSWMTRARLVESREAVCDEIAAKMGAGRENYARSLLRLASMLVTQTGTKVPHAIGIFDANTFERRIMKLTINRTDVQGMRRIAILALCTVCGMGTSVSAMALHTSVYLPKAQDAGASGEKSETSTGVSANVMAGYVLSKVTPVYPQAAKDARIQGAVVLHAIIGKDGNVANLQVVSGPHELTASALDAVRQWVYRPYLLNGEPTEVETTITVNYSLSK